VCMCAHVCECVCVHVSTAARAALAVVAENRTKRKGVYVCESVCVCV